MIAFHSTPRVKRPQITDTGTENWKTRVWELVACPSVSSLLAVLRRILSSNQLLSKPTLWTMNRRFQTIAIMLSLSAAVLTTGCVSSAYKKAAGDTPPPVMLNVAFPPAALEAKLNTIITYNGPGSWKRNAFWDEYVVTLHNPGNQHVVVSATELTDYADTVRQARSEPWALEKESKTLEQKYKDDRIAFVRNTAPGLLIVGAGAVAVASTGYIVTWGAAGTGVALGAGAAAAAATVVALPIYYIAVVSINSHNKAGMETEFNNRRLTMPLTLAPGETRTGSLFFPMVPTPRSLSLLWSRGTDNGKSELPLNFIVGLHVQPSPSPATAK